MKYKQGDTLQNQTYKRKILGICGEVIFLSAMGDHERTAEALFYSMCTEKDLEMYGFSLEKRKWEPQSGEEFWYINSMGTVFRDTWVSSSEDCAHLAFGNCFETKEQAEAYAEKIRALKE